MRDGKYFTIGDDGAEFFRYKKGDIIFNAAQTEEIFEKGKATSNSGRGRMVYAEGTAFSSGSGNLPSDNSNKNKDKNKTGSSGNSSSNGDDDYEEEPEKIDWIEVLIDRIERAIKKLSRIAESAFKTLHTRLLATSDEIEKVRQEIEYQKSGELRYLAEADSINLSEGIKKLVRDGLIDIREYDAATADLIKEYQEWYEKALDCADAVEELNETLAELYESRFKMVETEYENRLALLEHLTNTYSNGIDELEARGYLGGLKYYESLIDVEHQNIATMEAELADLVRAMNEGLNSGTIKQGSEAWYEMQQSINSVKESIQEANIAAIEYNNSMRELKWSYFDYLQDRISRIVDESEFLIDLMSTSKLYEDNGQLSDTGMATMGLHGVNYNTYMAQADKYAEELLSIDKEIAEDPYNTKLIERREELLDLQQESILAAEDEKQAIVDMVEEGIKLELKSLQDLIDAYNDSLDSAKDLYDYQKKVKDQTSEISKLQKQLAAYANDDSEENRARLQQIKVDLSEAQEALEETQYEQYIKDQKKLLDDLYSEYESILNARLDDIDALIADMIDDINANAAEITDTLRTESHAVGYEMTDAMNDIWSVGGSIGSVITDYGDNFLASMTSLNEVLMRIEDYIASMVNAGDTVTDKVVDSATPTTQSPYPNSGGSVFDDPSSGNSGTVSPEDLPVEDAVPPSTGTTPTPGDESPVEEEKKKVKVVNGQWWIRTGPGTSYKKLGIVEKGKKLEYRGQKKGTWYAVVYKNKDAWISSKGSKIVGYDTGGYIAGMQKVAMKNGDDMVTVNTLKKGEAVLTEPQANLFGRFVESLPQAMEILDVSKYLASLPATQASHGVSVGDINVNIPIDHVEDYDDLVEKMQRDPKFERFVQSMTVDQLVGGSRLAKHKYNWN